MTLLADRVGKGVLWVFITNILVQFCNFFVSVFLARILVPEDYGKVSLALVFISAFGIFKEMGLSQALIYRKHDLERAANVAVTLNFGVGMGLYLLIIMFSPLVDLLFKTSGLWAVTIVLGANVLITSGAVVPAALLDKNLQFRQKLLAEVLPVVIYAAISLPMAIQGLGVWSLAAGSLASALANTVLLWRIAPWRPRFQWDWPIAREMIAYGQHLFYTSVLIFIASNMDRFLLGKLVTLKEVGAYTLAFTIGNLPATQISSVAGKVLFPVYAKIGHEPKKLAEVYVLTFRLIAMVSIPAAFGLIAISANLIEAVYGNKWAASVVPLMILSVFGLLRSVGAISGNVFLALGKACIMPRMMITQTIVSLIGALALGLWLGLAGVAVGVLLGIFVSMVWGIALVVKWLPVSWMDILGYPMLYAFSAAIMLGVVVQLGGLVPHRLGLLVLQVALGAVLYCVLALLLAKNRLVADFRLVKQSVL